MAGPIICGVDDSESAKGAARIARGLSSKLGLGLVFLSVVEDDAREPRISATAERLERMSKRAMPPAKSLSASFDEPRPRRAMPPENCVLLLPSRRPFAELR